jgi:hypothetical protein
MIYRDKGLEVSIPSVSDLRVKDLRISEDDLGLKAAYAVSGEVGGERKAALILVIDELPSPIQTRLDRLNIYEVRFPASELSLPIDECCVLSLQQWSQTRSYHSLKTPTSQTHFYTSFFIYGSASKATTLKILWGKRRKISLMLSRTSHPSYTS